MTPIEQIEKMSPEEVKEARKRLGKEVATKVIVSIVVTVVAHVASSFLIDKLDGKKELEAPE